MRTPSLSVRPKGQARRQAGPFRFRADHRRLQGYEDALFQKEAMKKPCNRGGSRAYETRSASGVTLRPTSFNRRVGKTIPRPGATGGCRAEYFRLPCSYHDAHSWITPSSQTGTSSLALRSLHYLSVLSRGSFSSFFSFLAEDGTTSATASWLVTGAKPCRGSPVPLPCAGKPSPRSRGLALPAGGKRDENMFNMRGDGAGGLVRWRRLRSLCGSVRCVRRVLLFGVK